MFYKALRFRINLKLSVQRALLGAIYPNIRAIAIGGIGTKKLKITRYLDRPPTEFDYDNISDIAGEILGDMVEFNEVEEKCEFTTEYISKLDHLDFWAYRRMESF